MSNEKPSYELIHKDCGGLVTATLEDDGGCGDPECCGETRYHVELICDKCGDLYD